jgi:SAM-dependent methyltransferase
MIAHQLRYLWYLLVGTSAAPALKLEQSWWDEDYRREGLARIEGDAELPRHLLVAGLARHYAPGGAILDVGCGTAGLLVPLRAAFAGRALRYVGLDLSEVALQQATARRDRIAAEEDERVSVEFVQRGFDDYQPRDRFDAVIFSESLYYAPDPLGTVRRYTATLTPSGIVIVSMWRRPSRMRVWRILGRELTERSRSRLTVPRRPAWDIVAYVP